MSFERTDIGRSIAFPPEMVDTDPPPVVAELDYDSPMYRSSAFHWASRLIFIASKVMSRVYSLKPGISLAQRQAMVPELHLLLESWCVPRPLVLSPCSSPWTFRAFRCMMREDLTPFERTQAS